jgi:hypothetical protein
VSESPLFERVCDAVERRAGLARLAARGAVRLALREAGLEARTLNGLQVAAMLKHVLPAELRKCGIAEPDAVCADLSRELESAVAHEIAAGPAPEDMFRRIRGR